MDFGSLPSYIALNVDGGLHNITNLFLSTYLWAYTHNGHMPAVLRIPLCKDMGRLLS
jgi:hypothetical protein